MEQGLDMPPGGPVVLALVTAIALAGGAAGGDDVAGSVPAGGGTCTELAAGAACPWDLDGDGMVGIVDLLALLEVWGTDPGGPPDFDGDGVVGTRDFLELLANWGPCPFDILTDLSHGPASIAQELWSSATRNLLCTGDSLMSFGEGARLYDAILRSWDIPAGWYGFHVTPTGPPGLRRWVSLTDGYDRVDASRTRLWVTLPSFGSYYYGLPHRHVEYDVGLGFDHAANGGLIETLYLSPAGFDYGVVPEWFTGRPITAQLMYLYHSAPAPGETYAVDINVTLGPGGDPDGGPWSYADDYAPEHGLSDLTSGEPGINLLDRKHPVPTDQGPEAMTLNLVSTDNWSLPSQIWSVHLGAKLEGGPGNIFAAVLAETSWQSGYWSIDAPAGESVKQFTNAELDRHLDLMFDEKGEPLYVVVFEGPEDTALDDYLANNHARNDRFAAAWQRVGGSETRFIYLGVYRTGEDATARNQNEAFYETADQRDDTLYVNLYGLLGGILWNNTDTGGDQSAFAEARGWDAIATNGGPLDMSDRNALDDVAVLHPVDSAAAFFFAWVAGEEIREVAERAAAGR